MENETPKVKKTITKTINLPITLYNRLVDIAAQENRNLSNTIVNELCKHFANGTHIGQ